MKMPGATWFGVRNYTAGGQEQVLGLVVHIMDGTLEGSQAWFNNASAQASSHFGTGKAGALRQWVDTANRAWAQGSGNRTYLSIENEGRGGDSLTNAQIEANAKVFAWVHKAYGVPLKLATKVGDKGLAYHGLGGAAWGGHTSCPGPKIVAQLPKIVARAKELAGGNELDMTPEEVFKAVWQRDAIPSPTTASTHKTNPNWKAESYLPGLYDAIAKLSDKVDALAKKIK